MKNKLKKFLLLAGVSFGGFWVSVLLHNLFYGAAIVTSHMPVLPHIFEVLHVIFFFLAIPICPIGFLVGIVGSLIIFVKERR